MGSKRVLGVLLPVVGVMAAGIVLLEPPAWLSVLLGSIALTLIYIVARMNSRFDPLDQRFGSCIPPINWPPREPK